jgi:hypothetical protein
LDKERTPRKRRRKEQASRNALGIFLTNVSSMRYTLFDE